MNTPARSASSTDSGTGSTPAVVGAVASLLSLLSSRSIEAAHEIVLAIGVAIQKTQHGKGVIDGIGVELAAIATKRAAALTKRRSVIDRTFGLGVMIGSELIMQLQADKTIDDERLAKALSALLLSVKGPDAKAFGAQFEECATEIDTLTTHQQAAQAQLSAADNQLAFDSEELDHQIRKGWILLGKHGVEKPKRVNKPRRSIQQLLVDGAATDVKRRTLLDTHETKARKKAARLAAAMAKVQAAQDALAKKQADDVAKAGGPVVLTPPVLRSVG